MAIARQIADALEAAHQHGIVHRDLKPANISITPDGLVKVLDFGLARIEATEPDGSKSAVNVTGTGRILGTPAYMSPEQARGKAADRRTDIWAFGAVLFEMLTGERVFQGESVADTVAAVIHGDPRLDRLPPSTPWYVRATIDRCLQKDARDRARDIADVRLALDGAFSGPAPTATAIRPRASARWLAAAAIAGALLAGALVWVFRAPSPVIAPAMRFRVSPPEDFRFGRFVLSPDGRSLAFTDARRGALRPVGALVRNRSVTTPRTRRPVHHGDVLVARRDVHRVRGQGRDPSHCGRRNPAPDDYSGRGLQRGPVDARRHHPLWTPRGGC